jgi:hypothetical protein
MWGKKEQPGKRQTPKGRTFVGQSMGKKGLGRRQRWMQLAIHQLTPAKTKLIINNVRRGDFLNSFNRDATALPTHLFVVRPPPSTNCQCRIFFSFLDYFML